MPIGAITYQPQAKFWFPRSYVRGYCIQVDSLVTRLSNTEFTFPDGGMPSRIFHIKFLENFYLWTSNVWSLDYILTDAYYENTPDPTQFPIGGIFNAVTNPNNQGRYLNFVPFGLPFTTFYYFDNPPAPPSYWLPS